MRHDEFLARVRERGGYADQADAERAARAVLGLLAERLAGGEAKDLAAQLPRELQDALADAPAGDSFGVDEFVRRLADRMSTTQEAARWDASAVLTTVAEAVSGGEVNQVLTQLQSGYAEVFGKPDLA
jgi:uncharacterized protein (DUF2267 family)